MFFLALIGMGPTATPASAHGRAEGASPQPGYVQQGEITVRRKIIVRVPVHRQGPPLKWTEKKKSRKCINVDEIAGASLSSPDALDLIFRGGERWRMKFKEECPGLSFYEGFYLRPPTDRQICAQRDVIHPRSGGECEIRTFRLLKAEIED